MSTTPKKLVDSINSSAICRFSLLESSSMVRFAMAHERAEARLRSRSAQESQMAHETSGFLESECGMRAALGSVRRCATARTGGTHNHDLQTQRLAASVAGVNFGSRNDWRLHVAGTNEGWMPRL